MSLNPDSQETADSPPKKKNTLPPPCAGGCGFYGRHEWKNCCSMCYKKMYPNESQNSTDTNTDSNGSGNGSTHTITSSSTTNETDIASASSTSNSNSNNDTKPKKKVQKKKNRCFGCRKKITLAGRFECKCGYVFCSLHRYPDAHDCDFDYKQMQKERVRKENKLVAPAKFEKI